MKCVLTKIRLGSSLDRQRPVPDGIRDHLQQCAGCRMWYEAQRLVATSLRQPIPLPPEPPDSLHAGILRQVRSLPRANSTTDLSWFRRLALPAAVTCLAGTMAWWALSHSDWNRPRPSSSAGMAGKTDQASGRPEAKTPAIEPPPASWKTGALWETAAVQLEAPLRNEWAMLNADARSALGALKGTFLPEVE